MRNIRIKVDLSDISILCTEMQSFDFCFDPEVYKNGETFRRQIFLISVAKGEYSIFDTIHKVKLYQGKDNYVHKPRNFVCFYKKYFCYFEDYVESFKEKLDLQLYLYDNPEDQKYSPYDRYIFFQYAPKPEPNFIFVNTEQISRQEYFDNAEKALHQGTPLIDYSPENIYLLVKIPRRKFLLRYQYLSREVDALKSWIPEKPLVDVVFVGTMSPKRGQIIDALRAKGITVCIVQGWGEQRDRELVKGKLLLNLHFHETYGVYESIRCDRLIFSGMMVVTEKSLHQDKNDINELLFIAEYKNIVSKVEEILGDYENIKKEFMDKSERILPLIIQEREKDIDALSAIL